MTNEIGNGGTKLTTKQKLHEPILNPIQVSALLLIVLFEVVSNVLPILMGLDINPWWVLATLTIGIVGYAILAMLRAVSIRALDGMGSAGMGRNISDGISRSDSVRQV